MAVRLKAVEGYERKLVDMNDSIDGVWNIVVVRGGEELVWVGRLEKICRVYAPIISKLRPAGRGRLQVVESPLFPTYLFVCDFVCNKETTFEFGRLKFLRDLGNENSGTILEIPDTVVQVIIRRENLGEFDTVHKKTLDDYGLVKDQEMIVKGWVAKVKKLEGSTLYLIVNMLGRQVEIKTPVAEIL